MRRWWRATEGIRFILLVALVAIAAMAFMAGVEAAR